MRKIRIIVAIEDDTYPVEDLRELIESEGLTVTSFGEVRDT